MSKVITIFIDDILRNFSGAFREYFNEQYPNNTVSTFDIFNLSKFFESSEVFNDFFNSNFFAIISASETKYQGCVNDYSNVKYVLNTEGYKIRLVSYVKTNKEMVGNYFFLSKNIIPSEEVVFLQEFEDITKDYQQDFIVTTDYRTVADNIILLETDYNKEYSSNFKHVIKKITDIPKIVFTN